MNRGRVAADMNMMVVHDGKERSRQQWAALLPGCGFELTKVYETRSVMSIVEAKPMLDWVL